MDHNDEWQVARRCFSLQPMHKLTHPEPNAVLGPVPLRLAPVH